MNAFRNGRLKIENSLSMCSNESFVFLFLLNATNCRLSAPIMYLYCISWFFPLTVNEKHTWTNIIIVIDCLQFDRFILVNTISLDEKCFYRVTCCDLIMCVMLQDSFSLCWLHSNQPVSWTNGPKWIYIFFFFVIVTPITPKIKIVFMIRLKWNTTAWLSYTLIVFGHHKYV